MPEPHVYPPGDRPSVEVRVEGEWHPAVLRMRTQQPDGSYRYNAAWTRDGDHGAETHLDTFHARDVRHDTVDRSHGRSATAANPATVGQEPKTDDHRPAADRDQNR